MEDKIDNMQNLLVKIINILNLEQKEILNLDEVAELTSLKKSYIYKLNHEGKIPSYSYSENGTLYFKKTEIENWMTKKKRACLDDELEVINDYFKKAS